MSERVSLTSMQFIALEVLVKLSRPATTKEISEHSNGLLSYGAASTLLRRMLDTGCVRKLKGSPMPYQATTRGLAAYHAQKANIDSLARLLAKYRGEGSAPAERHAQS